MKDFPLCAIQLIIDNLLFTRVWYSGTQVLSAQRPAPSAQRSATQGAAF